jgi:hypothetical protein
MWLCDCDCGAKKVVAGNNLSSGNSKSCGCKTREMAASRFRGLSLYGSKSYGFRGCGDLSLSHYNQIKNCAKARDYEVDVSMEYLWQRFQLQGGRCALTGRLLTLGSPKARKRGACIGSVASLDRINYKLGYVEGNCQWVCKEVNIAKNAFSQDEFIAMCREVSAHCAK